MKRFFAFILCLLIALPAYAQESSDFLVLTAQEDSALEEYPSEVNPIIRVMLESLGSPRALGLTIDGAYSVDGDRGFQFKRGTDVALGVTPEGTILLEVGGAVIDMGASFTLVRHLDEEGAGGIYIHEAKKYLPYCGDMQFSVFYGTLKVICSMELETYLCGVVPYEMSDTFPLEALKAQAVAARSYAMGKILASENRDYDLVDTTNDQVFFGLDDRYELPIQAVRETEGIIGMWDEEVCVCYYTASNGGQTALAEDVWQTTECGYLTIKDDPYDLENPQSVNKTAELPKNARQWNESVYTILSEKTGEKLASMGLLNEGDAVGVRGISFAEETEPMYGEPSRQYSAVRFTVMPFVRRAEINEDGSITHGDEEELDAVDIEVDYYEELRTALGIGINTVCYDMFEIEETENGWDFTARRYGHGVGMSQRGAQQMAGVYKKNYREILNFYYPGMALTHVRYQEKMLTAADELPESLGYAAPRPTPAPTPKPLRALKKGEYYAAVTIEGVDSTLNVRESPSTSATLVGVLRTGRQMIVTEEVDGGWVKMETGEFNGYVMKQFISPVE